MKPELEKYREEIKEYIEQEEDVLSYALFPQVALNFFKYRQANKKRVAEKSEIPYREFSLYNDN